MANREETSEDTSQDPTTSFGPAAIDDTSQDPTSLLASFRPFLLLTARNLNALPVPLLKILASVTVTDVFWPLPKTKPLLVRDIFAWIEGWLEYERDEVGLWNGLRMLGKRKFFCDCFLANVVVVYVSPWKTNHDL